MLCNIYTYLLSQISRHSKNAPSHKLPAEIPLPQVSSRVGINHLSVNGFLANRLYIPYATIGLQGYSSQIIPRLFLGPCLRSICPERMVSGQAQGQGTYIPLFHLAQSGDNTVSLTLSPSLAQEAFYRRREQQPVDIRRVHTAQPGELFNVTPFSQTIQRHPQSIVSSQEAFSNISGIDQQLPLFPPKQVILASGSTACA